jgi:hypothetical protein
MLDAPVARARCCTARSARRDHQRRGFVLPNEPGRHPDIGSRRFDWSGRLNPSRTTGSQQASQRRRDRAVPPPDYSCAIRG